MNKTKDTDLPAGMSREVSGRIRLKVSAWSMQKNKTYTLSCGVYPNVVMAAGAKEVITNLIGTTTTTKKKYRKWQIIEEINEYRIEIGLNKLRQNYTK